MTEYYIEPRTKKYVRGYRFLLFAINISNKYRKQLLDAGPAALKGASKKVSIKQLKQQVNLWGERRQDCESKTCN